jgi:hypothetical protein
MFDCRRRGSQCARPLPVAESRMTASHLRPCPRCSRHVRVSEGTCPFCGAGLDASFRASPAPVGPSRRLSRAALFAFGTGAAVLSPVVAIDCGETTAQPLYGIAPDYDAGAPGDAGQAMGAALYGLFPTPDAAGQDVDAGQTMGAPPYGQVPPPDDSGEGPPDGGEGDADGRDGSVEDASDAGEDTGSDATVDAESNAGGRGLTVRRRGHEVRVHLEHAREPALIA